MTVSSLPRLVRENRFAAVDVETNGLSRQAEVIQLAIVQVDYGKPKLRAMTYVQPERPIDPGAQEVHGIDWYVLETAPRFAEVVDDVLTLIEGRCLIGYNINTFDYPILDRELMRAGRRWNPQVLDVLRWERKLTPKKGERHTLMAAVDRWGVTTQGAVRMHNAFDDTRLTWNLFLRMAEERPEFGDLPLEAALTRHPTPPDLNLEAL